jgi:ribonuclease HI
VLAVYGSRAPKGWFVAWCDGSSGVGADAKQCGLGVVLMDAEHQVVAEFGERIGALSPLAAEMLALESAVRCAVAHEAGQLRVYTDCPALIHLWQQQRSDERLARLREVVQGLRAFRLYLVPRRFNQLANRLARQAACVRPSPNQAGNQHLLV